MSTSTTPRPPTIARIGSLSAALASDKVVAATGFVRGVWWNLRPAFLFALRVAVLTLLLGLSRWVDFDSMRADIADAGTARPTMLTVFDAFDSVLRAAESIGSSSAAAMVARWLAWTLAVVTVVLCLVSILVSPSSLRSPRLRRSLAGLPRRMVREVFAVLIACGILARVAGKPDYLFDSSLWMNAVFLALVMGMTVLAEQRWMCTATSFVVDAPLPKGAAVERYDAASSSPGALGAAAGSASGGPIDLTRSE